MKPAGKPDKPKAGTVAGAGTKTTKVWSKPRITRHGNMRQLSQMSG
jgi:hypothetical protein